MLRCSRNCGLRLRLTRPTDHVLLFKHFLKQRLRPLEPFLRKSHRFHLAHGIVDHALVMQTAEHAPVKAFPGPAAVVQRQIEQRQSRIVDLVPVENHREPPPAGQFAPSYSGSRRAQSATTPRSLAPCATTALPGV